MSAPPPKKPSQRHNEADWLLGWFDETMNRLFPYREEKMGCRIMYDSTEEMACLYDSVTMTAFGPIATGIDAQGLMEKFLEWMPTDPRGYGDFELRDKWHEFCELFLCCNCGETLMKKPKTGQVCIACKREKRTT